MTRKRAKDRPWRRLREALGLSQEELGAQLGITQPSVSEIENGGGFERETLLELWRRHRRKAHEIGLSLEDFLRNDVRAA
jgi:transcriptional regulator with XRE-family HTH domain